MRQPKGMDDICEDCAGFGCELCILDPGQLDEVREELRIVLSFERQSRRDVGYIPPAWTFYRQAQQRLTA